MDPFIRGTRAPRTLAITWLAIAAARPCLAAGEAADAVSGGRARGSTSSSPIAVAPGDERVWVVNPDVDTATLFDVTASGLDKLVEVRVGDEPTHVAIAPDGEHVYVANSASNTVSVIRDRGSRSRVVGTIRVGTEPYGLAFTPNGSRLFVANARSNDVSVIDPEANEVLRTIAVDLEPRGIAVTDDGDRRDGDEKVYVTHFLGFDRPGVLIGRDDYKEGRVSVLDAGTGRVRDVVVLSPLADTGFRSNGSALDRISASNPPVFDFVTGAFPNQLNAIAIKGDRAYVPNTAASPNGPVRFNVNVQAFLSVIDIEADAEGRANGAVQTLNMNRGVNFEPAGPKKIFFAVPWQIAFMHRSNAGWVVSASSNLIVKFDLDEDGTPTIHAPTGAGDPGSIVRILVGQNPKGIAIDSRDRRAYVANEVSRDVTVIDLPACVVIATVRSSALPPAGSEAARLLVGKALFNSSTGTKLPQLGEIGVTEARLSSEGWSSCVACHPFGLTDNVVWIFGAGPRRTVPLNGSFNPRDPQDAKLLNYSAIFDEVQDFENNIRGVSGGLGLITLADGVTQDPTLNAFDPANAGRSARLDAMADWVARKIRTPQSPARSGDDDDDDDDGDERGRRLFARANCAACHGGGGWSSSRRDYTPPPAATEIVAGQVVRFLRPVGTFDPTAANEIRQNGAAPLGAAGFNPPSLLGVGSMTPVLHNGAAITIADVLENPTHRAAGTGGVDRLRRKRDRERLAEFVASIDARTKPFPITPILTPEQGKALPDEDEEEPLDELAGSAPLRLEPVRNPVRGSPTFAFAVERPGEVELGVYDVAGRRIALLARGAYGRGQHQAVWSGNDAHGRPVGSGVYFLRLASADGTSVVRKLVYAR